MATIGTCKRIDDGFTGVIQAVGLTAKAAIYDPGVPAPIYANLIERDWQRELIWSR